LRAKSVAELVRITVQAESLTTFRNEVGKTESGELTELLAPVTIPESAVDPRSRTSRLAILPDHTPKLTARE